MNVYNDLDFFVPKYYENEIYQVTLFTSTITEMRITGTRSFDVG